MEYNSYDEFLYTMNQVGGVLYEQFQRLMNKEGQGVVEVRQSIIKRSWGGMARKQGKVSADVRLQVGREDFDRATSSTSPTF